jgi:hypothetical protein
MRVLVGRGGTGLRPGEGVGGGCAESQQNVMIMAWMTGKLSMVYENVKNIFSSGTLFQGRQLSKENRTWKRTGKIRQYKLIITVFWH